MKVVMIGSGNVATILSRLIIKNSHQVVQVMSRNAEHAKILAGELGCSYADLTGTPDLSADIFIIAVSDMALIECIQHFQFYDRLVLHTAGSVSREVLNNASSNYGVLYPLQSLRKEMEVLPDIPFLIDGNKEEVIQVIEKFARTLSPVVQRAGDDDRVKLHVAAVIVSNFTNHLYQIAEEFCNKEKIDFNMLMPLIVETAQRIRHISPSAVQTGPAVRKDIYTLDKHLRVLSNHQKLRTTYLRLTDSIMNP